MKLIFTNYPFSKQEAFIFILENQDSVREFLRLFRIEELDKNIKCIFPSDEELRNNINKIVSVELKNFLKDHCGKEILMCPEKDDFPIPDSIHMAEFDK